jgi:hypothetical protein
MSEDLSHLRKQSKDKKLPQKSKNIVNKDIEIVEDEMIQDDFAEEELGAGDQSMPGQTMVPVSSPPKFE